MLSLSCMSLRPYQTYIHVKAMLNSNTVINNTKKKCSVSFPFVLMACCCCCNHREVIDYQLQISCCVAHSHVHPLII